jgi:hypothetical protein
MRPTLLSYEALPVKYRNRSAQVDFARHRYIALEPEVDQLSARDAVTQVRVH